MLGGMARSSSSACHVLRQLACVTILLSVSAPAVLAAETAHPAVETKPTAVSTQAVPVSDEQPEIKQAAHAELSVQARQSEPASKAKKSSFDMERLIRRLKESDAIGVFTKLALRSDALDLIELVKAWRRHADDLSLRDIRARYEGLLLKVLALLDDDPALSRDISMAREDIWNSLLEVKA